ncbi:MAG: hypothetical protein K8R59_17010 [Thermoanaerobaculales bacterium]|nr:hypothetical protein [Thermoanaerobaculales bacterium]
MRRIPLLIAVVCLMGLSTSASAGELTGADIVRAHEAGVSTQTLIQLIETTPGIAEIDNADENAMRVAGVSELVITAYRNRLPSQPYTEQPTNTAIPDDNRLVDIVRLVRSGLANDIVVEHVNRTEEPFQPTADDLIYLKQQQVPESIIKALLGSLEAAPALGLPESAPADPPERVEAGFQPTPTPSGEILTFSPLLRFSKTAGLITKATDGRLILVGGKVQWIDEEKPKLSFEFFDSVLKKVFLKCEAANCFEIRIKTVHGDNYRFRDADWKVGGNTQILALWERLKSCHTKVEFERKD